MAATFSKNTGKNLPRQLSCSHCGVDLIDSEIRHCSEGRCICTACLDTSDTECRICNPTASSSDESDSDDYLDDPLDNLASTSREEMEQDGRGIENKKKNYFKPVQVESDKEEQNIPIRPSIFTTIQELMPELDEVVEEMSAKDENAAEVKVFLQLYHQAGDELKNYFGRIESRITKRQLSVIIQKLTQMEKMYLGLKDKVDQSVQVQQRFVKERFEPFTSRVDATFRKHEAEHKRLREETSALAKSIKRNTRKQNVISNQMINANKQILRQLKALNDNSGQPQPEVRIEQPDSQVRQRGDLQPANGDNGNGTPPIVHTYVTTTTTEIFPPSCVCLYLGVAIPIFVTIFSWVLAKCLGIFQQI